MKTVCLKTNLGFVDISEENNLIVSISFRNSEKNIKDTPSELLYEARNQITAYFDGKLFKFSFPFLIQGTEFQQKVHNQLIRISYGETLSYCSLAIDCGNEKAYRAVGNAAGKNRLAIAVPCHRLISSDGSLGGFSSGLWRKRELLKLERAYRFSRKA
ncbi:MAG: methylated-DNA--[protein]-cysteine S-methyltransferase [Spirochaetes bacterium]|jgi:O-6-methylguanine DNA methyltransferase|nr:methylated-DNA--[protein]-cysteine S-methyltransferase [Spirochaetota bacterium]